MCTACNSSGLAIVMLDDTRDIGIQRCDDCKVMTDADAVRLCEAAPEMLEVLKRIIASAPLTGLPLALEKDIQDACALVTHLK